MAKLYFRYGTMNNGNFVVMGDADGESDVVLTSVCRNHYMNPPKV